MRRKRTSQTPGCDCSKLTKKFGSTVLMHSAWIWLSFVLSASSTIHVQISVHLPLSQLFKPHRPRRAFQYSLQHPWNGQGACLWKREGLAWNIHYLSWNLSTGSKFLFDPRLLFNQKLTLKLSFSFQCETNCSNNRGNWWSPNHTAIQELLNPIAKCCQLACYISGKQCTGNTNASGNVGIILCTSHENLWIWEKKPA